MYPRRNQWHIRGVLMMILHRLVSRTPKLLPTTVAALLSIAAVSAAASPVGIIRPGARWLDNRHRLVQAHGGCIIRRGQEFYLFGEDRSRDNDPHKRYVGCYKSTDLVHWIFCRKVVALASPNRRLFNGPWILERPKVFFNRLTRTYVMYCHIDNRFYSLARVAVFTCKTIDGHYQFIRSFQPLGFQSRDIGGYTAPDGKAYLLFEDRPTGFHIAELSRNYLTVKKNICTIRQHLEGLGLVHIGGLYYVVGSHLTGWRTNPDVYATARALAGPWSRFRNIAPRRTNTYNSQSGDLFKYSGARGSTVIYMGDRWTPPRLWDSRYIWMPLHISHGRMTLPRPAPWTLNLHTGIAAVLHPRP